MARRRKMNGKQVTLWIHNESFSKHDVVVAPDVFGEKGLPADSLMEIVALKPSADLGDLEEDTQDTLLSSASALLYSTPKASKSHAHPEHGGISPNTRQNGGLQADPRTLYRFMAKFMPDDFRAKYPTFQVSITGSIASTFGYRQRDPVLISITDRRACSASHVELIFRDQYLSRSDMWRLVPSELVGKTVYKAQKILFLGSIKASVKTIYVNGQSVSSAYFCETTVPVFRSESARYVLFVQMSKEMWDFDSEGAGETLFSRVIDGFLPELFKKWAELKARHLVSIVLFGRLKYDRHALAVLQSLNSDDSDGPSIAIDGKATYRDFYRVVVTDMASGQWTTILNALKKDFRVFLRDISLQQPWEHNFAEGSSESEHEKEPRTRICGQPTSAQHGNILEAINIASSQFATDYIDRDLVRTGVSVIVITPGTGIFEVDRRLLELTSENLTNNGIGIDLVCLSKMPLHSVPLFKWSKSPSKLSTLTPDISLPVESPPGPCSITGSIPGQTSGSLLSNASLPRSAPGAGTKVKVNEAQWSFGIPQWIDVSYWTPNGQQGRNSTSRGEEQITQTYLNPVYTKAFVPRVRMYELQMMGVMELGLANISVPYLSEGGQRNDKTHNVKDGTLHSHNARNAQSEHLPVPSRTIVSPPSNPSVHSPDRGRGLLSVQAKQQGDMYDRMDAYDGNLFIISHRRSVAKSVETTKKSHSSALSKEYPHQQIAHCSRGTDGRFDTSNITAVKPTKVTSTIKSQALNSHSKAPQKNSKPSESRISRSISFALRGLGPSAPRAVASTEINVENAQAEHSASNLNPYRALGDSSKLTRSPANTRTNRLSMLSLESEGSDQPDSGRQTKAMAMSPARPISIKNMAKVTQELPHRAEKDVGDVNAGSNIRIGSLQHPHMQTITSKAASAVSEVTEVNSRVQDASSPMTPDISPWIKTVNPSNPTKNRHHGAHWVGRWQHLYPHAPKTSTVKWKSLCTPASVPLTTEQFPSKDELEHHYIQTSYVISPSEDSELTESPKSRELLLREMISLRLAHGYQLVLGRSVTKAIGTDVAASADFFTTDLLAHDGVAVIMSMGNTVQKLLCVNSTDLKVTRFDRRPIEATEERIQSMTYTPVIRTILSKAYLPREMTLEGFSKQYPWNLADTYLAGQEDDLTKVYDQLRFWRARFVVIPVDPPPGARRPIQSMSEDNEEEIHLLGIRELTKMWQKARYTPPEERRFKPTTGKRKDPNPLEINFQTLNPSEVVATEIEKLLATDDGAENKQHQLLPDSELLERSTSSISKIAQMLQGEKGVDIANRRWHLRLHYSCFKGDDFTNWLLSSFKDIDTREEAVEFGNELMQHGLFHHVSTRHTFKDGNYFYMIAPEHRISRPESRNSWFPSGRRADRSVPATPTIEGGSHVSPLSNQSQSGWNSIRQTDTRASEKGSAEKRWLSVSLTKMMRIDVDHRNPKRSDRPEIVNLHYDRLHNPENCYHLELAWLNVTSKLIEDAIVTWATQSEKYGLRLVEVPIAEASSITDREPFRAPYRITLKVLPPPPGNVMVYNGTTYFTNTSFAPQSVPSADKLIYQKALLKKFDFVLDLEAASEFPPDVDVTYTWGKLGYRYSQFVHRSGVALAQITDEGELLLIANRLYNTRSASKDAAGKFETKNSSHHGPTPAPSGIVGLNAQNPSPHPSPLVRATSDVFGSREALNASEMTTYITPEHIKDELEEFCHDSEKLIAFYKEISERGTITTRKSGSTNSSVLRPVPEYGLESSIPDLRLPASVVTTTTTTAANKNLVPGLKKKSSPQPAARDRVAPAVATTDFGRRTSADSH